ncbi:hypothetical protein EYZ11_007875 [Aspergillus tanneri]|uniref:GST C-terminal domain-containing protein n=1 Tax=Aspergillus tanneri TaxID=1220188 RepID=A0A4S3JC95_9EURO|nr:hypothetical protein EYZ11_007875 [Aspergillus tanneri]
MNVFDERRNIISLYSYPKSQDGATAAIILAELKLPYDLHLINTPNEIPNEILSESHKCLPVLTDFDQAGRRVSIRGVEPIASYLIVQDHEEQLSRGGVDIEEMKYWLSFLSHEFPDARKGKGTGTAHTDNTVRRALHLYLHLEDHLHRSEWGYLVGKRCTLADLIHFPCVAAAGSLGLDIERFPELTAWFNRISQHGAVVNGMAAVQLNVDVYS